MEDASMRWRLGCALMLLGGLFGATGAAAQAITVSAASSLQEPMREIGKAFSAAYPDMRVSFNFAASGVLLAQIGQGAPVDVYASADIETMDRAQSRRLIDPATRVEFAANELVLISPASRPASFSTLRDLTQIEVRRIAIGNTRTVPAGRYARAALDRQRLTSTLTPKLVYAENVRQVLSYVARGEVDAGFVYRSDALLEPDKVRIDLAPPLPQPVLYPIARVAASKHRAAADAFIDFVRSAEAQAVLVRYGFSAP
jgi:molybdate transport system substrate-binding protein